MKDRLATYRDFTVGNRQHLAIAKVLHQCFSVVMPEWLCTVTYYYSTDSHRDGPNILATISTQPQYRQTGITFYPAFWGSQWGPRHYAETFVHELFHSYTQVLADEGSKVLDCWTNDPGPFVDLGKRGVVAANEAVVSDLTRFFMRTQYIGALRRNFEARMLKLGVRDV